MEKRLEVVMKNKVRYNTLKDDGTREQEHK